MEALKRVLVIIGAVIIFFFAPLVSLSQQHDRIVEADVKELTNDFCKSILDDGILTKDQYDNFIEKLSATNELYDVQIICTHRMVNPDYTNSNTDSLYTPDLEKYITNIYTDTILHQLYETSLGEYTFTKGDLVNVSVYRKNKSMTMKLTEIIYNNSTTTYDTKIASYGGEVRDELNQ